MKNFITLTAMTLVMAVSAQEKKMGQDDVQKAPHDEMEMFENLKLTDKQKSEIKTLFEQNKEDRMEMRNEKMNAIKSSDADGKREMTDAERKEFKAKKEAKRKEMDAKLQTILTPEQYKQFSAEREKRHEEMKKRKDTGPVDMK